ncbi:fibronectin type III domain-containing protein [Flagellimonas sp.]|uniref:fibronectin type III domain-containing protein n=1 Tax=Flagellimonas sp. TaxID=2058762 RepID=UPI003B5A04DE
MKKIKIFKLVALLFFPIALLGQNNLLDTSVWTVGPGTTSVNGFSNYGPDAENERALGTDPHGASSVLWVSKPDGSPTNTADGGFESSTISINPTKTYRFTVWIKKTGSNSGHTYVGLRSYSSSGAKATQRFDGTTNTNPYFLTGDLPELDKWFLIVGFIHPNSYSGSHLGGLYDGVTGNLVASHPVTDYKFFPDTATFRHRSLLYGDENSTNRQYCWDPTIYEVNGQEPTIMELLNPSGGSDTQNPTAPTLSNTGQTDTTVDLSWSGATDNVGVTGYKIFKDNSLETTLGNVTSYQVTGLAASTTYSFTITSLDAVGNESSASNSISVTTNASSGGGGGSSIWLEANSVASYSGDVGIGTNAVPSGYKLAVEGKIRTREIRVDQDTWPDYVFKEGYDLPSLEEIQKHIAEKGHLPNIPSAKEVKANGADLGEMDKLLLEKVEEMMLYIIELKKENKAQQIEIENLKNQIQ